MEFIVYLKKALLEHRIINNDEANFHSKVFIVLMHCFGVVLSQLGFLSKQIKLLGLKLERKFLAMNDKHTRLDMMQDFSSVKDQICSKT